MEMPKYARQVSDELCIIPITDAESVYFDMETQSLKAFREMKPNQIIEMLEKRHSVILDDKVKQDLDRYYYTPRKEYLKKKAHKAALLLMHLEGFSRSEIVEHFELDAQDHRTVSAVISAFYSKYNRCGRKKTEALRYKHLYAYVRDNILQQEQAYKETYALLSSRYREMNIVQAMHFFRLDGYLRDKDKIDLWFKIMSLRFYHRKSLDSIAERFGLSKGAISAQLSRICSFNSRF